MTLDNAIQLHESLCVWYAVDCYVAELQVQDGGAVAISCRGETPESAIGGVMRELTKVPDIGALRAMRAKDE